MLLCTLRAIDLFAFPWGYIRVGNEECIYSFLKHKILCHHVLTFISNIPKGMIQHDFLYNKHNSIPPQLLLTDCYISYPSIIRNKTRKAYTIQMPQTHSNPTISQEVCTLQRKQVKKSINKNTFEKVSLVLINNAFASAEDTCISTNRVLLYNKKNK